MDLEKIQIMVDQLRDFLHDDDSDAADVMDELQPMLEGSGLSLHLDAVYKAVNNYDFDVALDALKEFEVRWELFQ